MMDIIFIAPPAAGKGTISDYLVNKYGYKHLSTGDLLRNMAKEDSPLGHEVAKRMKKGELIDDEIIFAIIKDKIEYLHGQPFILDGIPRNQKQAEYLSKLFVEKNILNYVVINITISIDLLKMRITGRRLCPQCQKSYNIYFENFKPHEENKCDICHGNLITREDDTLETFQVRYQSYLQETKLLLEYYQSKNLLYQVDANQTETDILKAIEAIIKED